CQYGGDIEMDNAVTLFASTYNIATHFSGNVLGANVICIGGKSFGYRSNHGGSAFLTAPYIRGCGQALQSDNSAGMIWAHAANIQFCFAACLVEWNGSIKIQTAIVKNNAYTNMSIAHGGTIDAVSVDCANTAVF